MTRTWRRRWHAIALLAGRKVFRKLSENSVHQKVRECPLLVRLGTLIHPNQMPAQGRFETLRAYIARVFGPERKAHSDARFSVIPELKPRISVCGRTAYFSGSDAKQIT